jgi:ParB/RepB/Spo0J family partition protein
VLIDVPLDRIAVDPEQPRKYLPEDLRLALGSHTISSFEAISTLVQRAATQDTEAAGYLESIATLAKSIEAVGLLQPIHVALSPIETASWSYQLVDGERRLWACLYLNVKKQPDDPTRIQTVPALLQDAESSADDVRRTQWIANLQRESVPAIDYAEAVWRVREDYLSRLQTDRRRYLSELGDTPEDMPSTEAAVALTSKEIQRLTTKLISRVTIFRCCAITERLKPQTKALTRAYNLTFRQLMGLAHLPGDQQMPMAMAMIAAGHEGVNSNITRDTEMPRVAKRAGRPTQLQRGVNQCACLLNVLGQLTEKQLRGAGPESLQALVAELDRTVQEAERCRRLVRAVLNR